MPQEIGMDPDAVRGIATRLDAEAKRLGTIISTTDAKVRLIQQHWRGHSAQDFVGRWQHQFRPALLRAQESIAGLAQSARNNASAQDQTSAASGSSGSVAPSASGPVSGLIPADVAKRLEPLIQELAKINPVLADFVRALLTGDFARVAPALRDAAQQTLLHLQNNMKLFNRDGHIDGFEALFMIGTVEMGIAAGIHAIPGLNSALHGYGDVIEKAGIASHDEMFKVADARDDVGDFAAHPSFDTLSNALYSTSHAFGNTLQMVPVPAVQDLGGAWIAGPDAARKFGYDARVYYDDPNPQNLTMVARDGVHLASTGISMTGFPEGKTAVTVLDTTTDVIDRAQSHQLSDIPGLVNDGRTLVAAAAPRN